MKTWLNGTIDQCTPASGGYNLVIETNGSQCEQTVSCEAMAEIVKRAKVSEARMLVGHETVLDQENGCIAVLPEGETIKEHREAYDGISRKAAYNGRNVSFISFTKVT